MRLQELTIKNFRAIKEIQVQFDNLVSVIVGPNAIGKTTILEAIRMAKGLLAPRTQQESTQILFGLGASSPHMPGSLSFESLARDSSLPIEIKTVFRLSNSDVESVSGSASALAQALLQNQLGQAFGNPAAVIQFLSTDQGRAELEKVTKDVNTRIARVREQPYARLELTIQPTASMSGAAGFDQAIVAFLDQSHPPAETVFSYFPADRALPGGEPAVQLGAADAQQQLESHNSQPQLKYSRLKNTVFSTIIQTDQGRQDIQREFQYIFDSVLKGRRLHAVGINPRGMLSIRVEDVTTGQVFDLDAMSSGEKGLILTFLLISKTLAKDGLLLLDEPELHLNPAVCRDVLGFLVKQYAQPKNLQVIVCTHSPEILAGALDRDDCSLYHLKSETTITKIRLNDEDEVSTALQKLGTSESETLLYKGTVFVEGPGDVDLLEIGFEELLRRYKVKDLGGRGEIEKQIKLLKDAEDTGKEFPATIFVFDNDRAPADIASSAQVRILQWKRYCIENYLIELDTLTDILTDDNLVRAPRKNHGEVMALLRELAWSQLPDTAAQDVYAKRNYDNPGLRKHEIIGKSLENIADILYARLLEIRRGLDDLDEQVWKRDFIAEVAARQHELENVWNARWTEICDGKRLYRDLQAAVSPKMKLERFKRQVMVAMRLRKPETWRAMESLIKEALMIKNGG